jgi:hypothetical protein
MTSQAWDLLVRRLETTAKQKPGGYRLRVAALAALGYAYLGAVLLVLAAVVVGSAALVASGHPAALKALIPAGVLAFIVVRALPVKLSAPEGVELEREQAPELFAHIDGLRREPARRASTGSSSIRASTRRSCSCRASASPARAESISCSACR